MASAAMYFTVDEVEQHEVRRLRRAGDVPGEHEPAIEPTGREPNGFFLVATEVHADRFTAALRLRNEIEPALFGDERAQPRPIARVEQRGIRITADDLLVRAAQRAATSHERRL